jgi:hypothetical protein
MKSRKKKKHDEKQRQEASRLQKKRRLERALSNFGLLDGFQALPAPFRDRAIETLPSPPTVSMEPAASCLPKTKSLKKEIEEVLERTGVHTADGQLVPYSEILSTYWVLPGGFRSWTSEHLAGKHQPFLARAIQLTTAIWENRLLPALGEFSIEVWIRLLAYSRIDQGLFSCLIDQKVGGSGKPWVKLTVGRHEPRRIRVQIDGAVRPLFQCGMAWASEGIKWLAASGTALGLEESRNLPVFVQSHAIRRVDERLPQQALGSAISHYFLCASLLELKVVGRQGDNYLIEFDILGHRVGYLVGRLAQDKLIITTFLFLTMEGTPEFKLLKEKHGLTRRDIEYAGLDRLETFMNPEVRTDPHLVEALEECGCGSLLALRSQMAQPGRSGVAEELKRFLRLSGQDAARRIPQYVVSPRRR